MCLCMCVHMCSHECALVCVHIHVCPACAHGEHGCGQARTHAARIAGPRSQPHTGTCRWQHHRSRGRHCSCRCGCSRVPSAHCHRLQQSPVTLRRPSGAHGHQPGRRWGSCWPPDPQVLRGGFSRGRDAGQGHPPLWQLRPVHPAAQLQRPVTGWQCPSLAQEHLMWQLGPNQPAGHTAGEEG